MDTPPTIETYHAEVVEWRESGLTFRTIEKMLNERCVRVDHNAVYRYCEKKKI